MPAAQRSRYSARVRAPPCTIATNPLGGAIIWTINGGCFPSAAAGQRSPLLTALGAAVLK